MSGANHYNRSEALLGLAIWFLPSWIVKQLQVAFGWNRWVLWCTWAILLVLSIVIIELRRARRIARLGTELRESGALHHP